MIRGIEYLFEKRFLIVLTVNLECAKTKALRIKIAQDWILSSRDVFKSHFSFKQATIPRLKHDYDILVGQASASLSFH